jgi:hypothetical protein
VRVDGQLCAPHDVGHCAVKVDQAGSIRDQVQKVENVRDGFKEHIHK